MVLRLVSGSMLEKSNRTGPRADRQKVLLTARLRVSLFLRFSTTREKVNFQTISREFREISGKTSREILSSLIILTFFLIFKFQI